MVILDQVVPVAASPTRPGRSARQRHCGPHQEKAFAGSFPLGLTDGCWIYHAFYRENALHGCRRGWRKNPQEIFRVLISELMRIVGKFKVAILDFVGCVQIL